MPFAVYEMQIKSIKIVTSVMGNTNNVDFPEIELKALVETQP